MSQALVFHRYKGVKWNLKETKRRHPKVKNKKKSLEANKVLYQVWENNPTKETDRWCSTYPLIWPKENKVQKWSQNDKMKGQNLPV